MTGAVPLLVIVTVRISHAVPSRMVPHCRLLVENSSGPSAGFWCEARTDIYTTSVAVDHADTIRAFWHDRGDGFHCNARRTERAGREYAGAVIRLRGPHEDGSDSDPALPRFQI